MEFSEVLDGFGRAAPEGASPSPRPAAFWEVLDGVSGASGGVEGSRAAYRANAAAAAPEEPAARAEPSLDPADIAFELGIDAAGSLEDLKVVRRLFARANHPDRVPEAMRARANRRMTLANALIDAAAERFRR